MMGNLLFGVLNEERLTSIILEHIKNIFDVKRNNLLNYSPIRYSICINTYHPLRA